MKISLTGRVSIEANGTSLDEDRLPGRQGRLVFAYLLAEHGRPVPRDELAEALWGEAPPATWEKALAVLMSKLRALLDECGVDGQAALTSAFGCYQLVLPDGVWIDVAAASESADRAQAALAAGDLAEAKERSAAGAKLARRTFLPGEHGAWVDEKRRELLELLARSLECLAEACLQSGEAGEAVVHAEEVTTLEPFRESGYRLLMRAHSSAGNDAEALRVYEGCRRLLAEELGAYPSGETETIYLEILRGTPAGARPQATGDQSTELQPKRRLRITRRRLAGLVLIGAALPAAAIAIALTAVGEPRFLPRLDANVIAAIDADAVRPTAQVALESRPAVLAVGGGFLWVASEDGTLSRVDSQSRVVRAADLGGRIGDVAYHRGSLWATRPDARAVAQLDPKTLAVVQTIPVGNGPSAISAGRGGIWVANTIDGTVSRIDLSSGTAPLTVPVGERPLALAVGAGAVWVVTEGVPAVLRLDPRSGALVTAIELGNVPSAIAVDGGSVWVASRQDGTVSRIDPHTDSESAAVSAGANPSALAIGPGGAIWVANGGDRTIVRIDSGGHRIDRALSLESSPNALAYADGKLWVTTLPSPASHRGGILRVEATPLLCPCGDPGGAGFNIPVTSLAYDGLVAYRRAAGLAGGEIVADLALRVPRPSDGGKIYSFRVRRGVRYSNGALVRASDFRSSLVRLLTMNRGQGTGFEGIVGAAACARSAADCDLSRGIAADDRARRVTIRLTRADPDFLYKLTGLAAVPSGTPIQRGRERPVPGTGAYRIADVGPKAVRLTRNPYFRVWAQDARPGGFPDEIRFHFSDDVDTRLAAMQRGAADWVSSLPAGRLKGLLARYGARVHTDPASSTDFMFLNTRVAPFDDVRVRRALNYAVDRRQVAELAGGPLVAKAGCKLLPPATPGYRPSCRYTLAANDAGTWTAPDLTRARALVAASGTRGTRVEVFAYEAGGRLERVAYARYFAKLLSRLGYRSQVRVISDIPQYFDYVGDSRNRVQIGTNGWFVDTPSSFLGLFGCASFRPHDRLNRNLSEFCDRRIDAQIAGAATAQTSDPVRAKALWVEVDRALADQAATVPLLHRSAIVIVSERVGNYQYHPLLGTLLDQLWVR